jgi:glyoxylase-like metal-dependent hydrolase (beta-lactamase superfamily II)
MSCSPSHRSRFRLRSIHSVVPLVLLLAACGDDAPDDDTGDDQGDGSPEPTLVERTAGALGGVDAIAAARSEHVEATGTRLDPSEARTSREAIAISDFSYALTYRPDEERLQVSVVSEGDLLLPATLEYGLVIDGREGTIEGSADLFNPAAERRALPPAQLATRLKHTITTSLLGVMHRILADPDAVTEQADSVLDGRPHHVLAIETADHPPLRLLIDPDTSLPAALETVEHTPPLGDTQVLTRFADYQEAGALLLPREVTIDVDGLEVHRETRSVVEAGADDTDDLYAIPEELRAPYDDEAGRRGFISAQYLQGVELLGLSFLFGDAPAPLTFVELGPGVFHVQGTTHHVLLVEMADHLILVDAPLDERFCDRLRIAIAERFPDKPVATVVASHFHYDHVGGIRNFAADGGLTVVAGADSVPFHEAVFANPYSVEPDRYAASRPPVDIEGVEDSTTLTDGTRTVELHRIEAFHAADMLIVYLPAEGILFNADLWSPEQGPLVGYFLVGATDLRDEAVRLGIPLDTVVAGAHSTASGTLAALDELLGPPK